MFRQRQSDKDDSGEDAASAPAPSRAESWSAAFPGDASREAYRSEFRTHTPLAWELVQSSQLDLLRMLANRVPADIGVPVVLGLSVLFGSHPKADQASASLLGTIVRELEPRRARTLLVTLGTAWRASERASFDGRAGVIQSDMLLALRRLSTADLTPTERDAMRFLGEQLEDAIPNAE
jgi:hypothetical protein